MTLEERRKELVKQRGELRDQMIALGGAIQLLDLLIEEANKSDAEE